MITTKRIARFAATSGMAMLTATMSPATSAYQPDAHFLTLHPSGIYALPEIQPIYNFEDDHVSLWVGPEIGKILSPGKIAYIKPGFGIDPDKGSGDRDWTFEVGFRWFFD